MNRRQFLECAALLISGASIHQAGFTLTQEQTDFLASAPDYIRTSVQLFSPSQRRTVAAAAECIIPRTDTPGAVDAGVPRFIELMVADWFNEEERRYFLQGLEALGSATSTLGTKPFAELEPAAQLAILNQMEQSSLQSPWYRPGNVQRDFLSDAPFICQLKELTAWGFFTSEVGATQALRYDVMPMVFDGDVPLNESDSTWALVHF